MVLQPASSPFIKWPWQATTHARVTVGLPMCARLNEAGLRSHNHHRQQKSSSSSKNHHRHQKLIINNATSIIASAITNVVITSLKTNWSSQCPISQSPIFSSSILSSPMFQSPILSSPILSSPILSSPILSSPMQYSNQQNHQCCHHKFDFRSEQWLGVLTVAMRSLFF